MLGKLKALSPRSQSAQEDQGDAEMEAPKRVTAGPAAPPAPPPSGAAAASLATRRATPAKPLPPCIWPGCITNLSKNSRSALCSPFVAPKDDAAACTHRPTLEECHPVLVQSMSGPPALGRTSLVRTDSCRREIWAQLWVCQCHIGRSQLCLLAYVCWGHCALPGCFQKLAAPGC